MSNNTLIDYLRDNAKFRYVNFDRKHQVGTVLDERSFMKGLLGCGVIIAREDDVNVIKNLRGDVLRFTDQEVNAFYCVGYTSMTEEQMRHYFRYY